MPVPAGDLTVLLVLAVACGLPQGAQPPRLHEYGVRSRAPREATAVLPQEARAQATEAYRRALELDARGDADGALALLWTASGLAPEDVDIQSRLAEALERVGALDAAIDAWRTAAAAAGPGHRRVSRGLVRALVAAGRSAEAVDFARAAVADTPDDPDVLFLLGLAQSEQDVDAALAGFRRVLVRAPDHTLARYNLALVLKRLDRLDEAIGELRRVVMADPRPEAHHALGMALWHRGEASAAMQAFQAAIASSPQHADAHQMLGVVRAARRDWRGAAAALRRALALRPDVPATHETLARVLRASGDEDGARMHFAEGQRLRHALEREHEARVWTSAGTALLENGKPLDALDAFRRAVAVLETYASAHFQMGRALDRLGEPDAADGAYARARSLNPHLVRPPR